MGYKKKQSGEQRELPAKESGQRKSLAGQAHEYAAKGSKFRLRAPNKLVTYATMVCRLDDFAHLAVICSPEDAVKDCWTSFDGKTMERIDNVFGRPGSISSFPESYSEEIRVCYDTIEQVV